MNPFTDPQMSILAFIDQQQKREACSRLVRRKGDPIDVEAQWVTVSLYGPSWVTARNLLSRKLIRVKGPNPTLEVSKKLKGRPKSIDDLTLFQMTDEGREAIKNHGSDYGVKLLPDDWWDQAVAKDRTNDG